MYTCLHNNGRRTQNRVITDASASFDDASVINVDVFIYGHFAGSLCTLASLYRPRIGGPLQSRDGPASTNLRATSYHDPARVKHLTVRLNDNIVPNGEVIAMVAVKWRGQIDGMTQMTGKLAFLAYGRCTLESLQRPSNDSGPIRRTQLACCR